MSLGCLVIVPAHAAREGQRLNTMRYNTYSPSSRASVAILDTAKHASQADRLSKGATFFGALLNVRPFLCVINGEIARVEKHYGLESERWNGWPKLP